MYTKPCIRRLPASICAGHPSVMTVYSAAGTCCSVQHCGSQDASLAARAAPALSACLMLSSTCCVNSWSMRKLPWPPVSCTSVCKHATDVQQEFRLPVAGAFKDGCMHAYGLMPAFLLQCAQSGQPKQCFVPCHCLQCAQATATADTGQRILEQVCCSSMTRCMHGVLVCAGSVYTGGTQHFAECAHGYAFTGQSYEGTDKSTGRHCQRAAPGKWSRQPSGVCGRACRAPGHQRLIAPAGRRRASPLATASPAGAYVTLTALMCAEAPQQVLQG